MSFFTISSLYPEMPSRGQSLRPDHLASGILYNSWFSALLLPLHWLVHLTEMKGEETTERV